MRIVRIAGLFALAACASAPSGQKADPPAPAPAAKGDTPATAVTGPEMVVSTQSSVFGKQIYSETRKTTRAVAVPLDRAWGAMAGIFKTFGFELSRYDTVGHVISGQRARSRSPIGNKPLTSLLDCGEIAGIPNVTRYDINIQLVAELVPSAAGTEVSTHVTAIAKPMGFAGDPQLCTTTMTMDGQLANVIAEAIQKATR
ncbi:MAG: hypothetical protein ABJD07_10135 [Gemmatimonadaceae bacterium]